MRTFLFTLCAAFLLSGPVLAGANIKQKGSGATVWENQSGVQFPVGDSGLTVEISDVSVAVTTYVVTHRPGIISKVYAVLHGDLVDEAGARFQVFFGSAGDNSMTNISVAVAADRLELTSTSSPDPSYGSFTPSSATGSRTVTQGQIIGILSDGNAAEQNSATITIVIE